VWAAASCPAAWPLPLLGRVRSFGWFLDRLVGIAARVMLVTAGSLLHFLRFRREIGVLRMWPLRTLQHLRIPK
jgi:hypothetical protein